MIPSPKERPELYDGYDLQDPAKPASDKYWEGVMPEHLREAIAKRKSKAAAEPVKQAAE